jgi:hypothetical protein
MTSAMSEAYIFAMMALSFVAVSFDG